MYLFNSAPKFINLARNARKFNTATLRRIESYLRANNKSIGVYESEPGFLRITLPKKEISNLIRNKDDSPLTTEELLKIVKLRLHLWSLDHTDTNLIKDEIPHSHSRQFISHIIAGGYSHIKYEPIEATPSQIGQEGVFFKFNLGRDRDRIKFSGLTKLEPVIKESFSEGQTFHVSEKLIHLVDTYNIARRSTLAVNKVLNNGFGNFNVYLHGESQLKIKQKKLQSEKAIEIVDHMANVINSKIKGCFMKLYLFGVAGSGKNYVGELLQEKGFKFFDADKWLPEEIRAEFLERKEFTQDMRDRYHDIIAKKVFDLPADENIVIAQASLKKRNRQQILELNPDVKMIHVHSDDDTILRRVALRGNYVTPEHVKKMLQNFDAPIAGESMIVDNSDKPEVPIIEQLDTLVLSISQSSERRTSLSRKNSMS